MLEYWNVGWREATPISIIPIFHYSNFPFRYDSRRLTPESLL